MGLSRELLYVLVLKSQICKWMLQNKLSSWMKMVRCENVGLVVRMLTKCCKYTIFAMADVLTLTVTFVRPRFWNYFWLTIVFMCVFVFMYLVIMAALCNRGGIIFLPCSFFPSIFFFLFFPRLISAEAGWMSTTWCGPSANLECRSERCCTRLAADAGPKNVAKNRHLGTIPQLCRAISSQLRHISTIGKKTS